MQKKEDLIWKHQGLVDERQNSLLGLVRFVKIRLSLVDIMTQNVNKHEFSF
jgi:hypothetical protein